MDKKALLTGASEGIGRELAKQLAAAGFAVTAVARNEGRLKELLGELSGTGHRLIVADLATDRGVDALVADIRKEDYTLLVNNAGFGAIGFFTDIPIERQREMIRLNVEALTVLSHAFLSKAKSGDALINVSSVVGSVPLPAQPVYSATKAYVTALTECLSHQYLQRGVYVMALAPGATESKFAERAGGQKNYVPAVLMESAAEVAARAMKELEARRDTFVVSGRLNGLFVTASRLLPRRAMQTLLSRGTRRDWTPAAG